MKWMKTSEYLPAIYEAECWEVTIPNKDLLLVHYVPHDSYELAVFVGDRTGHGQMFEIPNLGFATLDQVDFWLKIPSLCHQ